MAVFLQDGSVCSSLADNAVLCHTVCSVCVMTSYFSAAVSPPRCLHSCSQPKLRTLHPHYSLFYQDYVHTLSLY